MKKRVFHSLLIGLFPYLFLYCHNLDYIRLQDFIETLFLGLCFFLVIWFVTKPLIKDRRQHALLVSLGLFLFFVYSPVIQITGGLMDVFQISYLSFSLCVIAVWLLVFFVGLRIVIKASSAGLDSLTVFANGFALVLWAASIMTAGDYIIRGQTYTKGFQERQTKLLLDQPIQMPTESPSIYFFILDGYARADILKELYNYDNSPFLEELQKLGFYVADKATSNYPQTILSVSATLNLDYIQSILPKVEGSYQQLPPLILAIHKNLVTHVLKQAGYTTVSFATGWKGTDLEHSDKYFAPFRVNRLLLEVLSGLNFPIGVRPIQRWSHDLHRERIQYAFRILQEEDFSNRPHFVFAHVVAPHPPFVFQSDGSPRYPHRSYSLEDGAPYGPLENYVEHYTAQLQYTSDQILKTLKSILNRKGPRPIIILQSDHGPGSRYHMLSRKAGFMPERFSILNAFYFPDGDYSDLRKDLSAVNTFRIIFRRYFGLPLPMLEDHSYFASYIHPYAFQEVTEDVLGLGSTRAPQVVEPSR